MNKDIKLPIFPNEFFKFGTSLSSYVSDEEINKWIEEGIEILEKDKKRICYSCATGDSKLIITREDWGNNEYIYDIEVAKGYYSKTVLSHSNDGEFYKGKYKEL